MRNKRTREFMLVSRHTQLTRTASKAEGAVGSDHPVDSGSIRGDAQRIHIPVVAAHATGKRSYECHAGNLRYGHRPVQRKRNCVGGVVVPFGSMVDVRVG